MSYEQCTVSAPRIHRVTVTCAIGVTLALFFNRAVGASLTGEQDACILYQNKIRLKSDPEEGTVKALFHEQVLLQYAARTSVTSLDLPRFVAGDSAGLTPVSFNSRRPNRELHITRKENETVVVNVTDEAEETAGTANVTENTTEVDVKHKIVKGHGTKHVVESDVDTKNANETDSGSASGSKNETAEEEKEGKDKDGKKLPAPTEKPFAKENVTIHKHILNITRRVNSTHNQTQNVTITETIETVDLSSPFQIASIYMLLFVPVAVAWAVYFNNGSQVQHYIWVLPLTMCAMNIGQDLVNQSLTLALEAPNMISAIQGFSMCLATGLWMVAYDLPALRATRFRTFANWMCVAVLFATYQIMNHLVYAVCSLSERTVITNLAPLVSLLLERVIMPSALKPALTFNSKLALTLMALGAVLFSIQSPTFTLKGICVALLLLLMTVPYRLAQRHFLAVTDLPLTTLACIDGFILGVPSVIISIVRNVHFWTVIEASTEIPLFLMLLMSVITFVGLHICGLAMLSIGSATTYLVFSNIASLVTISLGIGFFGDRALGTALACIGLATNVGSGIWYSVEVQGTDREVSPQVETSKPPPVKN